MSIFGTILSKIFPSSHPAITAPAPVADPAAPPQQTQAQHLTPLQHRPQPLNRWMSKRS